MEFILKNVGLVKDSTIKLSGLTVITGSNNSGKSTVGKALYASIEAFRDLEQKRDREIKMYFLNSYFDICRILDLANNIKYLDLDKFDEQTRFVIEKLLGTRFSPKEIDNLNVFEQLKMYYEVIQTWNAEYFLARTIKAKSDLPKRFLAYLNNFEEAKDKALKVIKKGLNFIEGKTLSDYSKEAVLQLLQEEFCGQIFPVNYSKGERKSKISLYKQEELGFDFTIKDDKEIINQGDIFNKSFVKNVVLIDDPYVLDKLRENKIFFYYPIGRSEKNDHQSRLVQILREDKTESIVEQSINKEQFASLIDKIVNVAPGELTQKDGNFYYSQNNKKPIRVENLATGTKLFTIIRALIEKGVLTLDTMLILDEPESHLHPEWQNAMAEIVVLLVKELGVNVLLTTHSTNFVLAIETYMRKYKLQEISNYYVTEAMEDGQTNYRLVNDNLNEIYANFVKYFSEMKAERAKYLDED